jgi:hypothetical protein
VSPGEPVPSVELKQKLLYRHEPPDYRVMKSSVGVAPPLRSCQRYTPQAAMPPRQAYNGCLKTSTASVMARH